VSNADLDAFDADAPTDDAPGDARACVVATRPDTFDACREGVYPCPRSYPRSREPFAFMAFYRTAPTSAITHYARVRERVADERGPDSRLGEAYWRTLLDPFTDEREATVFELGELVPLSTPVANDRNGVRGAWYCTVADLRAAGTVSDLAARAETA
jgi:hypothetical protein